MSKTVWKLIIFSQLTTIFSHALPKVTECIWCYHFRYTAVAMPMLYNSKYSSRRRVTVMISVVWVLSFAISCPLLFGLNNTGIWHKVFSAWACVQLSIWIIGSLGINGVVQLLCCLAATRDAAVCELANPSFVVYSSIMSFYVPFIITLLVYVQIYVVLHKRRKRVNTKRGCQAVYVEPHATPKVRQCPSQTLYGVSVIHEGSSCCNVWIHSRINTVIVSLRLEWQ